MLFGHPLWGDEFTEDRGTIRIIFPGGGVFILSTFIAINRLTTQNKKRWLWILLSGLGILIPILQATRQFIIGIVLLYTIHLLKSQKLYLRILTVVSVVFFIFFFYYSDLDLIIGIRDALANNFKEGEEYIRVKAGIYFLTEFSHNNLSTIVGNGVPYYGFSSYGRFEQRLADNHGYYLSDVGIIAVYVMFGIIAILGYLLIWIKSFTISLPPKFLYLKYYLWFLLLTSLTWYSVYHYSFLISTVLALYIYQQLFQQQRGTPSKTSHNAFN
ncbi:MAG: hypothetical protein LC101_03235 [Flavobacteriales bacterium]|nr:hypothetical protein [Flavobacteriales bacterium]